MRAICLSLLALVLCAGIVFGEFANSRDLRALWEAPKEQDVVAFDLRWRVGTADWDTLRVTCDQVCGACVDGCVPPTVACEYPLTVATDGLLRAAVRAVDVAGNVSVWDSASVTIDTAPPSGCSGTRLRKG